MSSDLPNGGYILTKGSTYLLDGFDFDEEPNGGVLESARLPSTHGMAGLPEGFLPDGNPTSSDLPDGVEAEDQGDVTGSISGMFKEGARLVDLNWLESAVQDFKRLPEQTVDTVIPELEEAWGVNRRTDGIQIIPNVDYPKVVTNMKNLPGDQLKEVVAHAMRRSACGEPIAEVVQEARDRAGEAFSKIERALEATRDEHGLVGNVYIRASVFPGLLNGRWAEILKKKCASAQYILVAKGSKEASVDRLMGKQVVTEIPWKEAIEHYTPYLNATGRKVASGDPREVLKRAFTTQSKTGFKGREASFPKSTHPMDKETLVSAEAKLAAYTPVFTDIPNPVREAQVRDRARVMRQVARWVVGKLLSTEDGKKLASSQAFPQDILDTAASLIVASGRAPVYSGIGVEAKLIVKEGRDASWTKLQQDELQVRANLRVRDKISRWVQAGLLTKEVGQKFMSSTASPKEILDSAVTMVASETQNLIPEAQIGTYEGPGVGTHFAFHGSRDTSRDMKALEQVKARNNQQVRDRISKLAHEGLLTPEVAEGILKSGASAENMLVQATEVLHGTGKQAAVIKTEFLQSLSDSSTMDAHMADPGVPVQARKEASGENLIEARKLLRWAGQKLSEGSAGRDFDDLLRARFSPVLLKNASGPLETLRKEHEGLAGHLYVDASAYASEVGIEGCDRGALKHRANSIKMVLAMSRCASCVNNSQGTCQKYGKVLMDKEDLKDIHGGYQQEVIRLTDSGDAEATASLFQPGYDAREYDLQNGSLEGITYDSTPCTEDIGDILFDGLVLP